MPSQRHVGVCTAAFLQHNPAAIAPAAVEFSDKRLYSANSEAPRSHVITQPVVRGEEVDAVFPAHGVKYPDRTSARDFRRAAQVSTTAAVPALNVQGLYAADGDEEMPDAAVVAMATYATPIVHPAWDSVAASSEGVSTLAGRRLNFFQPLDERVEENVHAEFVRDTGSNAFGFLGGVDPGEGRPGADRDTRDDAMQETGERVTAVTGGNGFGLPGTTARPALPPPPPGTDDGHGKDPDAGRITISTQTNTPGNASRAVGNVDVGTATDPLNTASTATDPPNVEVSIATNSPYEDASTLINQIDDLHETLRQKENAYQAKIADYENQINSIRQQPFTEQREKETQIAELVQSLESIQGDLAKQRMLVAALLSSNAKLENDIRSRNEEYRDLQTEVESLQYKVRQQEEDLDETIETSQSNYNVGLQAQHENEALQQELETTREKLEQKKGEIENLNQKIVESTKDRLREMQYITADYEKFIEEKETGFGRIKKDLEEGISALRRELSQSGNTNIKLEEDLRLKELELTRLNNIQETLRHEVNHLRSTLEEQQRIGTDRELEMAELTARLTTLEALLSSMARSRNEDMTEADEEDRFDELIAEIARMREQLEHAARHVQEATFANETLRAQNATLAWHANVDAEKNMHIEHLLERIRSLEEQIKKEKETHANERGGLLAERQKMSQDRQDLLNKQQILNENLESLQQNVEEQKTMIEKLLAEKGINEKHNEEYKQELQNNRRQLMEASATIAELTGRVNTNVATIDELERNVANLTRALNESQSSLANTLKDKDNEISGLKHQLGNLNARLKKAKTNLKRKSESTASTESQTEQEQEIAALEARINELEKKLEEKTQLLADQEKLSATLARSSPNPFATAPALSKRDNPRSDQPRSQGVSKPPRSNQRNVNLMKFAARNASVILDGPRDRRQPDRPDADPVIAGHFTRSQHRTEARHKAVLTARRKAREAAQLIEQSREEGINSIASEVEADDLNEAIHQAANEILTTDRNGPYNAVITRIRNAIEDMKLRQAQGENDQKLDNDIQLLKQLLEQNINREERPLDQPHVGVQVPKKRKGGSSSMMELLAQQEAAESFLVLVRASRVQNTTRRNKS